MSLIWLSSKCQGYDYHNPSRHRVTITPTSARILIYVFAGRFCDSAQWIESYPPYGKYRPGEVRIPHSDRPHPQMKDTTDKVTLSRKRKRRHKRHHRKTASSSHGLKLKKTKKMLPSAAPAAVVQQPRRQPIISPRKRVFLVPARKSTGMDPVACPLCPDDEAVVMVQITRLGQHKAQYHPGIPYPAHIKCLIALYRHQVNKRNRAAKIGGACMSVSVYMSACARVRVCVRACVRMRVRACVLVGVCVCA